jgi:hypothetical protein
VTGRQYDNLVAALLDRGLLHQLARRVSRTRPERDGGGGGLGRLDLDVTGLDLDPEPYRSGGVELVHGVPAFGSADPSHRPVGRALLRGGWTG